MKILWGLLLSVPLGCGVSREREAPKSPPLPPAARAGVEMPLFIEQYQTDRGALERAYNVPFASRYAARMTAFHDDWEKKLAAVDFASLSQDGRVDYLLFKNRLHHDWSEVERRTAIDDDARTLVPFGRSIADLEEQRRAFELLDPEKAAGRMVELARAVKEARKGADSAISRPAAHRAAGWVDRLRSALKNWHGFYAGYDPLFTWWVEKPWKEADQALEGYASLLRDKSGERKEGAEGLVGAPIGREELLSELALEMIPYTPEELLAIAEREFAWCELRMKEAARELGCGDDWSKALELVKSKHVPPGKQPELIRDLAREAIEFLDKRDLVTIPDVCREVWRMEMMPPERQRVTPYFTGGEVISVSYPTADMPHEQKQMSMRGNNIAFCHATVHHEVIPGHHLQLYMSERHNTHRKLFRTPFLVEGWALYWEMLLWDLGFARNAEEKVGMLFWRVHRCARIIVSLGFHLGTMAPPEMVDFLVKRVGHELDGATAEVRRYIGGDYGPLYQAAYMLGGLQLRALYQERVSSGKMTPRAFHDAVLRENAIPVEMIRASLTKQDLAPEFRAQWRFAGD
jgi:uncharacterized protein (DUF885 family)